MDRVFFESTPSLSINVVDSCIMNCLYCPPHGANLIACETLCPIEDVIQLIDVTHENGLRTVRITGGEPLLAPERTRAIMEKSINIGFSKILLNTNGVRLDSSFDWLLPMKEKFKLKISIDTLNSEHFKQITQSSFFDKVLSNTICSVNHGFNIEINSVLTEFNIYDLDTLLLFCSGMGINLKLLTVNDFCGTISCTDIRKKLRDWLKNIVIYGYREVRSERLDGNRGIKMLFYQNNKGNTLTVLDHINDSESLTPSRVYSLACDKCYFYPCSTGMLNLALRADGLLQPCRMIPEQGCMINGTTVSEKDGIVKQLLSKYFKRSYIK